MSHARQQTLSPLYNQSDFKKGAFRIKLAKPDGKPQPRRRKRSSKSLLFLTNWRRKMISEIGLNFYRKGRRIKKIGNQEQSRKEYKRMRNISFH